jgi:hypothetical protein
MSDYIKFNKFNYRVTVICGYRIVLTNGAMSAKDVDALVRFHTAS